MRLWTELKSISANGFGLCAAELRSERAFVGFIGFLVPAFEAHFTPCVEIGWRLLPEYWGRGLATEGARRMIVYASEELSLEALVSFTVPAQCSIQKSHGEAWNDPRSG